MFEHIEGNDNIVASLGQADVLDVADADPRPQVSLHIARGMLRHFQALDIVVEAGHLHQVALAAADLE